MSEQKMYGYARVSTREQKADRQLIALREAGVPADQIYVDKMSGKDFERPQYKKMLRKLSPDSVLFVKSIDRLGRNYSDLQEQWRIITKEKGADVVVLDMPLLDTRQEKNLLDCVVCSECRLICFFADDTIRVIDLKDIKENEGVDKVLSNEKLYQTGMISPGGYAVTFNDSIDIPAYILHRAGTEL